MNQSRVFENILECDLEPFFVLAVFYGTDLTVLIHREWRVMKF